MNYVSIIYKIILSKYKNLKFGKWCETLFFYIAFVLSIQIQWISFDTILCALSVSPFYKGVVNGFL
jgi:hypothetical protein